MAEEEKFQLVQGSITVHLGNNGASHMIRKSVCEDMGLGYRMEDNGALTIIRIMGDNTAVVTKVFAPGAWTAMSVTS